MCAEAHEEASHDLSSVTIADSSSMLVIIVYHTSCRCARENLKIFRFSKGKRGLGAKTPFSVFWRRPKHKKDKKNTFRCFSYYNVSDVSDKPARSSVDRSLRVHVPTQALLKSVLRLQQPLPRGRSQILLVDILVQQPFRAQVLMVNP